MKYNTVITVPNTDFDKDCQITITYKDFVENISVGDFLTTRIDVVKQTSGLGPFAVDTVVSGSVIHISKVLTQANNEIVLSKIVALKPEDSSINNINDAIGKVNASIEDFINQNNEEDDKH